MVSVAAGDQDHRNYTISMHTKTMNALPQEEQDIATEQGDDLFVIYMAVKGNISPYHMTLAAYAGRFDFAKKLWNEALSKTMKDYRDNLPTGAVREDVIVLLLRTELADLSYLEKWWTVATTMLKPFMIHFNFKHASNPTI